MSINLVKEPTSRNFDLEKKPNPKKPKGGIGIKEPSGGLVPIFDTGLWITPDEPADPQDCERYPTSAFCDPFFFTLKPFEIEPSIAIDRCNIGVRLDYSFGFIRLPPISLVYRDPSDECKPPPPPEAPPVGANDLVPFPPNNCSEKVTSLIIYGVQDRHYIEEWVHPITSDYYFIESTAVNTIDSIQFPYTGEVGRYLDANGIEQQEFAAEIRTTTRYREDYSPAYGFEYRRGIDPSILFREDEIPSVFYVRFSGAASTNNVVSSTIIALMEGIPQAKERLKNLKNDATVTPHISQDRDNNYVIDGYIAGEVTNFIKVVCGLALPINNPPPPIEDNPPPRHCCMSCCPSQGEQDNSLLNLLIQKVDKLSNIVGVNEYPVSLPSSLISKDEGFLGNLIPNNNVDIPNLTTFFAWYIERFDEIMGQWEIPIEVKDTDPTKPGDQPVGFRLPNMAEAIAEMFGLMLQTSINSQISINMQTRTMLEVGQNKQQIFKSYMLVLAIADHLGFDYKEIKHKIPMLFDINQTQLDKLLQESEIEVTAVDYTDKEDLKTVLLELRQAAAIIRAVHWRKFDLKSDVAQGVKDLIMGLVKTSDEVNDSKEDDNGKDKFDDFLEDVERGFTTSSGITDPDHPYGRNYNERPRIKEIGQESPGV